MTGTLRHIALMMSAIVLAVGIAVGGKFIGDALRAGPAVGAGSGQAGSARSLTVEGRAERVLQADRVVWPIRLTEIGDDLGATQSRLEQDVDALIVFLVGEGLAQDSIERGPAEVSDLMARGDRDTSIEKDRFILSQTVTVRGTDATAVAAAAARLGELVKMGLVFAETGGPRYSAVVSEEVRAELVAEAGTAARGQAEKLASALGGRVGAVHRAHQRPIDLVAEGVSTVARVAMTVEFLLID